MNWLQPTGIDIKMDGTPQLPPTKVRPKYPKYGFRHLALMTQVGATWNCIWCVILLYSLAHVPSINMEKAVFMIYAAASHQGGIKMIWLHFLELLCRPSLF